MTKKILIAFTGLFLISCNKACFGAELTESDVKRIVEKYIQDSGKEISMSVDRYLAQKKYEDAEASIQQHSPVSGESEAKVTIIEFSDYRCGYCGRVQETITELRRRYGDRVKFAFKYLPILSEESRNAAFAAHAAHKQGKFWEFHNGLWKDQSKLGDSLYESLAKELKLDMSKFNKDRAGQVVQGEVFADYEDGQGFGASGTPFFLVNGEALSGAQPLDNFVQAIEAALEKAEK